MTCLSALFPRCRWGETKPVATNSTQTGRARNRRVEFHLLPRQAELHLRTLVADEGARDRIAADAATVTALRQVAAGRDPTGAACDMGVRLAAADVLLACEVDWRVHRLLLLAARKGTRPLPGRSPSGSTDVPPCWLALLDDNLVRRVMVSWFLAGFSA